MSYDLKSHASLQASVSQYYIDDDAPVALTLRGPQSYCYLNAIQDQKLKEILGNVGIAFEQTKRNAFFNFTHTFSLIETSESNSDNDNFVQEIFASVNRAINNQTSGEVTLNLTDINELVVQKAEDRSFLKSRRAYELSIDVSSKVVERAEIFLTN